ncbi:hypothetical protein D3C81_1901810 [compost metagenome]
MHDADRQFGSLATVLMRVGDNLLADDHRIASLLNVDRQRVAEQMAVLHNHLQSVTQGALMPEQQADFAEVRQLA